MKIYAISDTHFNHKKLVDAGHRPEDFEERMLKNLDRVSGDLLIHCGDFAIGRDAKAMDDFTWATRNFKRRILVRGNHDSKSDAWYVAQGFDFVCESFSNTYFGKKVLFTHIPVLMGKVSFDFNVHGHMHGNAHRLIGELAEVYDPKFHLDLAPELHNYSPVNLEYLLSKV